MSRTIWKYSARAVAIVGALAFLVGRPTLSRAAPLDPARRFVPPVAHEFAYLGDPPSKWEGGPNAAAFHDHAPPSGPWRAGSATFSIMGAGFVDASGFDNTHGAFRTSAITALNVPGFDSVDDYAAVIDWALDQWAGVSGFTNLGRVADGNVDAGAAESLGGHLGDIRVAAWEIVPSTIIARTFQPGTEVEFGPGGTIAGDLYFDVARNWVDDPLARSGTRLDIYTVALHEVGHALGLGHSSVSGAVMQTGYHGARRQLTSDDIAAIQAVYGVPEPGTWALATSIVLFALARKRCGACQQRQRRIDALARGGSMR